MESDTRAEAKFARKYTIRHQQKHQNMVHPKKKHRERVQCVASALPSQVDRICNQDQIKHKALDFTVTDDLYEKTASPRYRYHWEPRNKANPQNHKTEQLSSNKEDVPKCVHLYDIYEHLYLSNIYFAESYFKDATYQFDIIINVSGNEIPKGKGVKIYNFNVEDTAFAVVDLKIIETIMNILEYAELNNLKVLIHCMAGTNRSPFFAILYALRKNPSEERLVDRVNWWIDYIDKCKANAGYKNWDTLTNRSYINRLLCQKI